ncbi:unnamed protein product [Bursaphelenchus okinawaensis]|uniref:Uncharacterized protein n=1 Tax=Bursaphelenchus okinawaensis TaxID=465554 RepID=A0A811K8N9_9BILA|nr:unnamed protein product [Bursaphelenchus okinawaensis]CAG9093331.1 unnamed protein product [Bursaphelenchus okinawaensis]
MSSEQEPSINQNSTLFLIRIQPRRVPRRSCHERVASQGSLGEQISPVSISIQKRRKGGAWPRAKKAARIGEGRTLENMGRLPAPGIGPTTPASPDH